MAVEWHGVRGVRAAAERGLDMALDALREDAVARSPTESGEMDRSAIVEREGLEGAVGFDSEYAVIQHERQGQEHDDGGPGFLRGALESLPIEQLVGEQLKREIGG